MSSFNKILALITLSLVLACGGVESDVYSSDANQLVDEPGVKYLPGSSLDPDMSCHYHLVHRGDEIKKIEHCVPIPVE